MNRICNTCNIEIDDDNYLNDRTVCKSCYNRNRRKNHQPKSYDEKKRKVVNSVNNTNKNKKKIKVVDSVNNNNRTLIIKFSNCGKTYLMTHILQQKQEPIFTDEIQPIEFYENSTVVFDDMLLLKQESNIDLFFTRGRHNNIDIYYISQSYFHLPKNTIRNNSKIFILSKQTLRDIILLFHDIAGLDMNLDERKQLCRKAWENDFDYLQIDRFAKIGNGRYTIRNCNKKKYIECTPETKPF